LSQVKDAVGNEAQVPRRSVSPLIVALEPYCNCEKVLNRGSHCLHKTTPRFRTREGVGLTYIGTEGEVSPEDLSSADDAVSVKRRNEFETLVVNSQDGKVVSARRRLPKKYRIP
jgi:hypothetical protein